MRHDQPKLKKKYGFENPFKPDPLSRKALKYLNGRGKLLDIGCGEGADSVFFAQKGYRVTAIDKNQAYVNRFRMYRSDHLLSNVRVLQRDVVKYSYPHNTYDALISILVLCCMKRSEFEALVPVMKRSVKPGGIIVMSSRNYLDPELKDYVSTEKMIEENTFRKKEDCCKFLYFIEKNRLREVFSDFDIIYYFEGYAPCKYNEHPKHGDSYIICKRK